MKKRRETIDRDRNHRGKPSAPETASSTHRTGLTYGVLPVIEALRANARRAEKLIVAEGAREKRLDEVFDLARRIGVPIDKVPRESLARLTGPDANHQGVALLAAAADYVSLEELLSAAGDPPLFVVLDGVEDPRNLGAVLRTVECAGADGVIIPERRAVGLTETVAKSSAGAAEYVKVAKATNLNRLIEDLKERNIWVVGTSGDATTAYTEWDWKQPSALVLGAEGTGLHRLVRENCDVLVNIPMYGKIESLNVSVAAGVILFEAQRQRTAGNR